MSAFDAMSDYQKWIQDHDTIRDEDRQLIRQHIALLPRRPLLSVVMPVYNTPEGLLRDAIRSVRAQLYPTWELCIADDASPDPTVQRVLNEESNRDRRIRWVTRTENGHISAATNTALGLAEGEFVVLIDHDDLLPENALYEVALEVLAHPDADVIYSDEDRIDGSGRRSHPYFKPMWSPELLAAHNMISHLGVYRRSLVNIIGGLREGFEGSQDWDLALRATAATTPDRVRHIPSILYHWRWQTDTPSFSEAQLAKCQEAGRRSVEEWLLSEGNSDSRVEPARMTPGWTRVVHQLPDPLPFVTVIIPSRDGLSLLKKACDGILRDTAWQAERLELIVVDNGSTDPETVQFLGKLESEAMARVIKAPGPFNYSHLNNLAAASTSGDILALLNNDIEVMSDDWLMEMVSVAIQPEVGAVGAKLLYPDGTVQHGGVLLGPAGHMTHVLCGASGDEPGYYGQLALRRSLSAVTGACMVLRREVFDEAGGLDEGLAVAFNDVDLCLRLRDLGYRIVWTPDAVLVHHESATRGSNRSPEDLRVEAEEHAFMRRRWGRLLDSDPYHNPNLLLHQTGGPMIPAAPRRLKPWRRNDLADYGYVGP